MPKKWRCSAVLPLLASAEQGGAVAAVMSSRSASPERPIERGAELGNDPHSFLSNPNFEATRLEKGVLKHASSGEPVVLKHTRQAPAGTADTALGALLMRKDVPGVHRFVVTIAASTTQTGTGIRIGIASDDGQQTFAVRPWDGTLYPPVADGDPRYSFLGHKLRR